MTSQKIKTYYAIIQENIKNKFILRAITDLKNLVVEIGTKKYDLEIENIETNYMYMLQYLKDGINDPQRNDIYNKILLSLYSISDKIKRDSLFETEPTLYYGNCRVVKAMGTSLPILIEKYNELKSKVELCSLDNGNSKNLQSFKIKKEEIESDIFKYIWSQSLIDDSLKDIINKDEYEEYFKDLIISSLLLSTMEFYDENKINVLFDAYENSSSVLLQTNALIALVILSLIYNDRIKLSKYISHRITLLQDNSTFMHDLKSIAIQFIKSQDTERITKKMQDELIPQLMKLSPGLYKKFKSSNKPLTDEDLQGNPDWQNILEDSGINKKLQELNDLQMEGADVLMGTFAHLKSFPFFQNISNWFIPFHKDHSLLSSDGINPKIADTIIKAPFLCNSDKYSFLIATLSVPENQKELMLSQFNSQALDMKELKASELSTPEKERDKAIAAHIQDLYRFFKLFNRHIEFSDPFSYRLLIDPSELLDLLVKDSKTLEIISELYFKRESYNEAIDLYTILSAANGPKGALYQKIGFCYQNLGNYDRALDNYLKSDIINSNNSWTLKHIALCLKLKGNFGEALKYYKRAEELQPENMSLLLNIGHTLLELDNVQEALKYYYKVDYLNPDGYRTIRPIAWCEFIMDNYKRSTEYYNKIKESDNTAHDYLNKGHLYLATHDIKAAINAYNSSLKLMNGDFDNFKKEFYADLDLLINKGIDKNIIPLIMDCMSLF